MAHSQRGLAIVWGAQGVTFTAGIVSGTKLRALDEPKLERIWMRTVAEMRQEDLAAHIRDLLEDVLKRKLPKKAVNENVVYATVQQLVTLQPREAECLCRRYGITETPKPLVEIGRLIGQIRDPSLPVTDQMAGFIVRRALRKMRHPVRSGPILKAMKLNEA